MDRWHFNGESPQPSGLEDFNFNSNVPLNMNSMDPSFTWEMIGLGLEEPLPPQETIDELHQIFFEKIHPSLPMIHRYRYLAAMNLAPNQRPPVALRYAIWTLACSVADKYADLKELFYKRARKYMEGDYVRGYGEHMISVAHCQTHVLLASYEFKMMYFPRAWMNSGSAVRLCQMIGLHRLDGNGLDVKQCLPPPRDWTEREERRRTFWMAFCQDRYASIGTGWPMAIDERDIMTQLPASEEAFNMSRPEQSLTLAESMSPAGAAKLSSFGGIVLMACLFGRNLTHLHRPDADDRDHDMNGEFWKRHRGMDNILLNTSLCLPNNLKLPSGLGNPNVVFTNMNIHTSTICLHQAAIFKADRNRLPATVSSESKVRCITAANEIASIMRMVSHLDLSAMNPFISFCLYVAARVFVQYLKSRPDDSQTADALRFLLAAMNALKRKNPLTESFLVQLDVDLEALGVRIPKLKAAFPRSTSSGTPPRPKPMHFHKDANQAQPHQEAGILNFNNDCNYMDVGRKDGNPLHTPDIVEPEGRNPQAGQNSNHFDTSQDWFSSQQHLPTRERGAGTGAGLMDMNVPPVMFNTGYVENHSSDANDLSVSSNPDGPSSGRTPNSSSASENQRQNLSGTGPMTSSGRTSFEASPIGSQPNLGTQSEIEAATAAFFSDQGFGMGASSTGMASGSSFSMADASGNDFTLPNGWNPGQSVDGNMRGILDSMDLRWDSGTESLKFT
ncbi:fungal-specific transcription factor [Xylariomycetidae sp. FL0641]|nr:fungal-specific transcription factor [Xylariomycetidae sp. FL0641]